MGSVCDTPTGMEEPGESAPPSLVVEDPAEVELYEGHNERIALSELIVNGAEVPGVEVTAGETIEAVSIKKDSFAITVADDTEGAKTTGQTARLQPRKT